MTTSRMLKQFMISSGVLFLVSGSFPYAEQKAQAAPFIAGVHPDQRRTDTPVINKAKRDQNWQKRALTGISQPVPKHILHFLRDQGNWFSPFLRPGMHGRYDIRGWHRPRGNSTQ